VQAGTAVSRRVRHEAGNSVNLIAWAGGDGPRRCVVERWDFDERARVFGCVGSEALELDAPPAAV
jgi:hypothetical protein